MRASLRAMTSKPTLKLDWCSHAAAKFACERWHYSSSLPTPPLVKVGVWEDGDYIGCVLFSRGANNNIGKSFGLSCTQVAELTRVALASHIWPVTRIVRVAIQFLRQHCRGVRLVVSYADPSQGHSGSIYQAGNWLYVGQSQASTEYLAPDGKQWHGRMVSASGRTRVYGQMRSVWRHDQCKPVVVPGKHKYLYPLDDEMRRRIEPLRKPYPKRAGSAAGGTAGHQPVGGGSTPTPALSMEQPCPA